MTLVLMEQIITHWQMIGQTADRYVLDGQDRRLTSKEWDSEETKFGVGRRNPWLKPQTFMCLVGYYCSASRS